MDAIITENDFVRATELPNHEVQTQEESELLAQLNDFTQHPGWRIPEQKFQNYIERYRNPTFPVEMPDDMVGKEYRISQTIATILQEIYDDLRA